jgi:hypothetical protein
MVTALPLRRLDFSPLRGIPSLLRSPDSLNRPPVYWRMACVNVNNRFNALSKSNATMKPSLIAACLAVLGCSLPVAAEDGYDLWLRYQPVDTREYPTLAESARELVGGAHSPTLDAAQSELVRGLSQLSGRPIPEADRVTQAGAIVFGTPRSSAVIAALPTGSRSRPVRRAT